jgi:hypothetical protein
MGINLIGVVIVDQLNPFVICKSLDLLNRCVQVMYGADRTYEEDVVSI